MCPVPFLDGSDPGRVSVLGVHIAGRGDGQQMNLRGLVRDVLRKGGGRGLTDKVTSERSCEENGGWGPGLTLACLALRCCIFGFLV